jgi:peptidoglycan/xylan/chitin deacetylase (PgdA/CDA1 family)
MALLTSTTMRPPRLKIRGRLHRLNEYLMGRMLGPISSIATAERVAALTFDDGPDPDATPRLLEVLEGHRARATFFMVGKAAQRHPDLVHRVAAGGHVIGNHSWDHPSLPLLSGKERRMQIHACARALTPYGRPLFRAPYGHLSAPLSLEAMMLGYQVIGWSGNGQDWLDHDAQVIFERLIQKLHPGGIIVLHDALYHAVAAHYTDRQPMIAAVDRVLQHLGSTYRFVTVPELLRLGPPRRRKGFPRISVKWLNSLNAAVGDPRRYAGPSR